MPIKGDVWVRDLSWSPARRLAASRCHRPAWPPLPAKRTGRRSSPRAQQGPVLGRPGGHAHTTASHRVPGPLDPDAHGLAHHTSYRGSPMLTGTYRCPSETGEGGQEARPRELRGAPSSAGPGVPGPSGSPLHRETLVAANCTAHPGGGGAAPGWRRPSLRRAPLRLGRDSNLTDEAVSLPRFPCVQSTCSFRPMGGLSAHARVESPSKTCGDG